jgi:hypothetical protein
MQLFVLRSPYVHSTFVDDTSIRVSARRSAASDGPPAERVGQVMRVLHDVNAFCHETSFTLHILYLFTICAMDSLVANSLPSDCFKARRDGCSSPTETAEAD